jgi:uncharacterized membrane protein
MLGFEVSGILGLIWLFIIIWAIIKVGTSSAGAGAKALWILLLILAPLIGLIIWILVGPKGS